MTAVGTIPVKELAEEYGFDPHQRNDALVFEHHLNPLHQAAPDLLGALNDVKAWCLRWDVRLSEVPSVEAAIAKANGVQA